MVEHQEDWDNRVTASIESPLAVGEARRGHGTSRSHVWRTEAQRIVV